MARARATACQAAHLGSRAGWLLLLGLGGLCGSARAEVPDTGDSAVLDLERQPLHGTDADEDTWPDSVDCAPQDPSVYPGAPELCNGLDDDCDGVVDDLEELCNGLDDDCDGRVDELAECRTCGGEREPADAVLLLPLLWGARRRR